MPQGGLAHGGAGGQIHDGKAHDGRSKRSKQGLAAADEGGQQQNQNV